VVLDGLMPKVNGFDAARAMRGKSPALPIVMMSGVYKTNQQIQDAREKLGVAAYLVKPFEAPRLVETLKPFTARAAPATTATPPPPQGTLLESPPLYLLWRAAKESHTGILELLGDGARARVFLFRGRCALAQHSDSTLHVGAELIRDGALAPDRLQAVV